MLHNGNLWFSIPLKQSWWLFLFLFWLLYSSFFFRFVHKSSSFLCFFYSALHNVLTDCIALIQWKIHRCQFYREIYQSQLPCLFSSQLHYISISSILTCNLDRIIKVVFDISNGITWSPFPRFRFFMRKVNSFLKAALNVGIWWYFFSMQL